MRLAFSTVDVFLSTLTTVTLSASKERAVFYVMVLEVAPSVVVAAWGDFRSDLENR